MLHLPKVTNVTENSTCELHSSHSYSYKSKYISMKVKLMLILMTEMYGFLKGVVHNQFDK